jgi:hypothetical protein
VRLTDFHAKYFASELIRRYSADSLEKLAPALADAQVDLNPHQVDAALFAFKNPFSKGAILADEVGLGKTIEAGLLLAQKWAERKRRLLVVVPANLRKQWSQELSDKFHLPSVILEKGSFDAAIRQGNLNPFKQDAIIICSYQFVRMKEPYIAQAGWDLVVSDEAHHIAVLEPLTGKSGWLTCERLTVTAMEAEDHLLLAGMTDDGASLDDVQCRRLFDLAGTSGPACEIPEAVATALADSRSHLRQSLLDGLGTRNGRWFDGEMEKLDAWAEDRRTALKSEVDDLDQVLREAKKAARLAGNLPEKLSRQREVRVIEGKRDEAFRAYDQACRDIDRKKDELLDEIGRRLEQTSSSEVLFTLRFHVV